MKKVVGASMATAKAMDKFSTPARRRRIIADVATFLIEQYYTKACKNVHRMRVERAASVRIQCFVRTVLAIARLKLLREGKQYRAVVRMQTCYRCYYARLLLRYLRHQRHLQLATQLAMYVQSLYRMRKAKSLVRKLRLKRADARRYACIVIQCCWRTALARTKYKRLVANFEHLQCRKHVRAIKIQSVMRMFLARRFVLRLKKTKIASRTITRAGSMFIQRMKSKQTEAAITIQRHVRRMLCKIRVRKLKKLLKETQQQRLALELQMQVRANEENERKQMTVEDECSAQLRTEYVRHQREEQQRYQEWLALKQQCDVVIDRRSNLPTHDINMTYYVNVRSREALEHLAALGPEFVLKWAVAQNLLASTVVSTQPPPQSPLCPMLFSAFALGPTAGQLLEVIGAELGVSMGSRAATVGKDADADPSSASDVPKTVYVGEDWRLSSVEEFKSSLFVDSSLNMAPRTSRIAWGQPLTHTELVKVVEDRADRVASSKSLTDTNLLSTISVASTRNSIDISLSQCFCLGSEHVRSELISCLATSFVSGDSIIGSTRPLPHVAPAVDPFVPNYLDRWQEHRKTLEEDKINPFSCFGMSDREYLMFYSSILHNGVVALVNVNITFKLEHHDAVVNQPKAEQQSHDEGDTSSIYGKYYRDWERLSEHQQSQQSLPASTEQHPPCGYVHQAGSEITPTSPSVLQASIFSNEREYLRLLGVVVGESYIVVSTPADGISYDDSFTAWFGDIVAQYKQFHSDDSTKSSARVREQDRQLQQRKGSRSGTNISSNQLQVARLVAFEQVRAVITVEPPLILFHRLADDTPAASSHLSDGHCQGRNGATNACVLDIRAGTKPKPVETIPKRSHPARNTNRLNVELTVDDIEPHYHNLARLIQKQFRRNVARLKRYCGRIVQIIKVYKCLRSWKSAVIAVYLRAYLSCVRIQSVARMFICRRRVNAFRQAVIEELRQSSMEAILASFAEASSEDCNHSACFVRELSGERDMMLNKIQESSSRAAGDKKTVCGIYIADHIRASTVPGTVERFVEYKAWENLGIIENQHPMTLFDDLLSTDASNDSDPDEKTISGVAGTLYALRAENSSIQEEVNGVGCWPQSILSLTAVNCPQPDSTLLPVDRVIIQGETTAVTAVNSVMNTRYRNVSVLKYCTAACESSLPGLATPRPNIPNIALRILKKFD
jgi:hypothetical protein